LGGDSYETVRGSVDQGHVIVEPVRAVWHIHLFADCPNCRRTVDLCEASDWWMDGSIEPLEQGTPKADDYEVACPDCGHEFRIKCEW
jgi:ssDNA-binding Zn-finger/Zn-ribbon topoisomerase 1